MIRKLAAVIVLTFLAVPFVSLAQSPAGTEKSIQSLSAADIAEDSIVMLSKEETDLAGYVHQQYAFNCFGELQVIDYYGAPLDPKDQNILRSESQLCSRLFFGDGTDQD